MKKEQPKITRIDFYCASDGKIAVNKYYDGWNEYGGGLPLYHHKLHNDLNLEFALNWCENNGFIVRRWHGGARAFYKELRPVRTAEQIRRMRKKINMEMYLGSGKHPAGIQTHAVDLAYDL